MLINAGQLLIERAKTSPGLDAVVDAETGLRLTFSELNGSTNQVAHALVSLGVQPGERVGVLMSNGVAYVQVYFALLKIGAIAVLLNWRLTVEELSAQIEDSQTGMLLYSIDHHALAEPLKCRIPGLAIIPSTRHGAEASAALDAVAASMPNSEPPISGQGDDVSFLIYTSGTTGKPKGAMHTHGSTINWSQCALATVEMRLADRGLILAPLFHVGGLALLINYIHRGCTSVIAKAFDAEQIWQLIESERINHSFAVPAMMSLMYRHPSRASCNHASLRWIMVGAAPLPVSIIEEYAGIGIDLHQVYGSTETHGGICIIEPQYARSKAGSTGKAYFGLEVRVVDSEGRDVEPGIPGEVITRGPHLIRGYWNQKEATEKAFKDGWFYLGDIAVIDKDGFIYIKDRSKDVIISGGENIYPAEIESALIRHPAVLDVAVIAQRSERWGESPLAVVVADPEVLAADVEVLKQEILDLCRLHLARYKHPRAIEFVEALPRNPTGKVLKHLLRERFTQSLS